MTGRRDGGWVTGHCSSGKREHPDRRSAKAHARRMSGHLRPYECGECGTWHVGHLPLAVIRGRSSAGQYYSRAGGGAA